MSEIKESIVLTLDASGIKANSLSGLVAQLQEVEKHIQSVNSTMQGMGSGAAARSKKEIEALLLQVKGLETKGGALKVAPLASALGMDEAQTKKFEGFVARQAKALDGWQTRMQSFRTMPNFAAAMAKFEKESMKAGLGDLLHPRVSQFKGGTISAGSIKVDGQIGLVIPGAQVQASVSGPITLTIAGSQITGAVPGNQAAGTGQFVAGNTASKKGKAGKDAAAEAVGEMSTPSYRGEVSRTRREKFEDGVAVQRRDIIKAVDELGQMQTSVHDAVEGIIATTTHKATGLAPLAQFREARAAAAANFRQARAALDPNDLGFGLARLQEKQAAQLRTLLSPELKAAMGPVGAASAEKLLAQSAATLSAQAQGTRSGAQQAAGAELQALRARIFKGYVAQTFGPRSLGFGGSGKSAADSAAALQRLLGVPGFVQPGGMHGPYVPANIIPGNPLPFIGVYGPHLPPNWAPGFVHPGGMQGPPARQWNANPLMQPGLFRPTRQNWNANPLMQPGLFQPGGGPPPKPPKPPKAPPLTPAQRLGQAFNKSFSPVNFAEHIIKVGGWAAAVGVLYKSFELASHGIERFNEIGTQTAHLAVVFRGVGGSAKQLTDDVMQLASANGRSTDEAMESATEWSRLGLNRVQVNEAVRVSMNAANVAQIHTGEATKQLSSLMHIYHLEVNDLDGVLGMLTNSSLKYNVTLEDLFQGLDRSAGVAREAGMGLAELQGLLAATVGKTGQSGIIVGNTIKSILVQFSNPAIQKMMRSQGVEVTSKSGGMKNASLIMKETFLAYQGMDERSRNAFSQKIAGRFGASRFVGMMDGYIQAQALAIDGQLHLNAAQLANVQIVGQMKAQYAGLKTEFDRVVIKSGVAGEATGWVRTGKNILRSVANGYGPSNDWWAPDMIKGKLEAYRKGNHDRVLGVGPLGMATIMTVMRGLSLGMVNNWSTSAGEPGLFDYFNDSMETSAERGQSEFKNKTQGHYEAAHGYRDAANTFDTVAKAMKIKGSNHGLLMDQAAGIMDNAGVGSSAALRQAFMAGDTNKVQAQLELAGSMSFGKSALEEQRAAKERENREREIGADPKMTAGEKNAAKKDLRKQEDDYRSSIREETGEREQQIARAQEYVNLLREQQEVMTEITRLSSMQTLDSAGSRNDAEVRALAQQRDQLEAAQGQLARNGMNQEGMPAWDQTTEMLRSVNADLAAKSSRQVQTGVGLEDDRAVAGRAAKSEADASGYGYTEAEKLLRKEKYLGGEVAKTLKNPDASGNDLVRAAQMQIELAKTQERIQERIVELRGQEKQIMIDSAREYQKSLLMAGPGELLKKLYVGQVASKRAPSLGEFMSWDPAARETYYAMRGGDAGAHNREEQGLLQGHELSVVQQQKQGRLNRGTVGGLGNRLGQQSVAALGDASDMPLPQQTALEKQALKTAGLVKLLGDSFMTLGRQVDALGVRLEAVAQGGRPAAVAKPAPKAFDLGTSRFASLVNGP